MLKNYIKVTLRNLLKHKGYSFINITGLAIGLASCFLIFIYINYELSYESFQEHKSHIYRTLVLRSNGSTVTKQTLSPPAYANSWKSQFPEIEKAVRYSPAGKPLLSYNNEPLPKNNFAYADSTFFEVFSFKLTAGNPEKALSAPMSLVIPKKVAQAYFPNQNPIGQTIEFDKYEFTVTGVLDQKPDNTHLKFEYLASINSIPIVQRENYPKSRVPDLLNNYLTWNFNTYLFLQDTNPNKLEGKINDFIQNRDEENKSSIELQPIEEIHFTKGINFDTATGNLQYIYIFSAIAVLVLVIAGFNFINLTTAKALKRAKEVGIRKVLGAEKKWLVTQFIGEAVIYVIISFLLSVLLLELVFPYFKTFIGEGVTSPFSGDMSILVGLALISLVTGILAGCYPAFFLSSFRPVQALKQKISGQSTSVLRKGLTIFQFTTAAFLFIGTLFIYNQMQYMKNFDPGFQKEQIAHFNLSDLSSDDKLQFNAFHQELIKSSAIKRTSRISEIPGEVRSSYPYQYIDQGVQTNININTILVDHRFLETLDIAIKKGRNFRSENSKDTQSAYIINEAAARKIGLNKPVGTPFKNRFSDSNFGEIIGVVENFQYAGLQNKIEPLVLDMTEDFRSTGVIKMTAGNISQGVEKLENTWELFYPGYPLEMSFLDNTFDQLYQYETNLSKLLGFFSGLSILVACLGLVGLSSFMAQQREKEIGIRKVLGSKVSEIVFMLNKDFLIPVTIGILIAIPISWMVIANWLKNFAYSIKIDVLYFVLASVVLLVISFFTVSYHATKAAVVNPTESLKTE